MKCEDCGGEMRQMEVFSACPTCIKKRVGETPEELRLMAIEFAEQDMSRRAEEFVGRMLGTTPNNSDLRDLAGRLQRLEADGLTRRWGLTVHDKTTCPLCVWRSKWEEFVRSSGWQPVPEGEEACKAAMEPLDKLLLSHPHNTGALSKDEIAWHNDEFVRQHSVFASLIWGEFDEEKDGGTEPR